MVDRSLDHLVWTLTKALSPSKAPEKPLQLFGGASPVEAALKWATDNPWIASWLLEGEDTICDALARPIAMLCAHGASLTEKQVDPDEKRNRVFNAEFKHQKLMMPVFGQDGFTAGLMLFRTEKQESAFICRGRCELRRYVSDDKTGDFLSLVRRREQEEVEVLWIKHVGTTMKLKLYLNFDGHNSSGLPEKLLHQTVILERRSCPSCDNYPNAPCNVPHEPLAEPMSEAEMLSNPPSTRCQSGTFTGKSAMFIFDPNTHRAVLEGMNLTRHSSARTLDAKTMLELKAEVMQVSSMYSKEVDGSRAGSVGSESSRQGSTHKQTGETKRRGRGRARTPEERERLLREKEIAQREKQERKRREQARRAAIQKVKNRISAARCNKKRKERIEATRKELAELKTVKPTLELKQEQLLAENERLKKALLASNTMQWWNSPAKGEPGW